MILIFKWKHLNIIVPNLQNPNDVNNPLIHWVVGLDCTAAP